MQRSIRMFHSCQLWNPQEWLVAIILHYNIFASTKFTQLLQKNPKTYPTREHLEGKLCHRTKNENVNTKATQVYTFSSPRQVKWAKSNKMAHTSLSSRFYLEFSGRVDVIGPRFSVVRILDEVLGDTIVGAGLALHGHTLNSNLFVGKVKHYTIIERITSGRPKSNAWKHGSIFRYSSEANIDESEGVRILYEGMRKF